ncbi:MAG TPA: hypothetical protein VL426_07110 [Candidatus Binatia bacterium]|jgi:predicted nucleotidyltransferase|nr:hypothetical protein [Candidatus Binatia bacterium]
METPALRRSLAATLAYFDLFDHPLTLAELLRHRYRFPGETGEAPTAADALDALDDPAFGGRDGFWHLAGRDELVAERERRHRLSEKKFARARRVARFLRLLPSVRLAAVCNSLAISGADEESDIDMFVVARPGTVWATRFVVASALAALGLRPDEHTHADKVCMSFYVAEPEQDLSRFALAPDDTYLRYWTATLVPLYDAGGAFARFSAANAWVRERLPGASAPSARKLRAGAPRWTSPLLPLLRLAEAPLRRLQTRMFPPDIAAMANKDSRVVVTDGVLKFHVNDRRAEYQALFEAKLRELGLDAPTVEKLQAPSSKLEARSSKLEARSSALEA